MTTEAMTTEAALERAAIRNAGPLYTAKAEATAAEARAEAAKAAKAAGLDVSGRLAGAPVELTAEAKAEAAKAAKARALLPAIVWVPAPKAEARQLSPAEAKAEAAAKATAARQGASIAREIRRQELAEARAIEARQARRDAVVHSAEFMFSEATAEGQLGALAKAAKATGKLAKAEARADYLAESGQTEAEAALTELMEDTGRLETFGTVKDAGANSTLSPAELAEVQAWAKAMHDSPAARAGRLALDAMGPRASAMVITTAKARTLTIAKVQGVPRVELAEARTTAAKAAEGQARAALEAAEARAKYAATTKAKAAAKAAEAEADRLASVAAKAAAKLAKAEAAEAEAIFLAARPEAEGKIWAPVATLKLAEAAEAADVPIKQRRDVMPARYADRGPSAKSGPKLTDNTAKLAIAAAMGQTEAAEAAAAEKFWDDTRAMIRALLTAKAEAEAEAEEIRGTYKQRRAAAARARRRAAKR